MNPPNPGYELHKQIAESAGARFLDRSHARSFSLNIFQMNALELMEASRRVRDPDHGFSLMLEKNREAGRQAHRELNRHVHNFAAAALTLVEHTRNMMREHYANTEVRRAYEDQVAGVFANEPVANFVQGLRNYMIHKGLPSSHMFLSFERDPVATDGSGTQETGVRYDTASLLEWSGWKEPARRYLEDSGEHLDVHRFAEEYLVLVNRFHAWLDSALRDHHQADLQELGELQQRLLALSQPVGIDQPDSQPAGSELQPFKFGSRLAEQINQAAFDLLSKLRELVFAPNGPQGFPTQRPIAANLTDTDLIGTPTFWGPDVNGEQVFMFLIRDKRLFGLSEQDHRQGLLELADAVLVALWAREKLSRNFIEETFIDWARERFGAEGGTFVGALTASARNKVTHLEVWVPVAHLEVEEAFEFGPVRVAPITAEMIDSLETMRPAVPQEQQHHVEQFFQKLRHDVQGYAGIIVPVEAEPHLAAERGRRIAQDALSLLRFLSPTAGASWAFCPVALSGSDYVPTSKLLVTSSTGFSMTERVMEGNAGYWRMSSQELGRLRSNGLNEAASLVLPEGLTEFALAVRANIIVYSKGMTMTDPIDRLEHALSALEGVLLKHEMEPVAANVAARMSFLLAKVHADREQVAKVVRQAYWLREQPRLTPLSPREDEALMLFISHANGVIRTALSNLSRFVSKADFVAAVDKLALTEA